MDYKTAKEACDNGRPQIMESQYANSKEEYLKAKLREYTRNSEFTLFVDEIIDENIEKGILPNQNLEVDADPLIIQENDVWHKVVYKIRDYMWSIAKRDDVLNETIINLMTDEATKIIEDRLNRRGFCRITNERKRIVYWTAEYYKYIQFADKIKWVIFILGLGLIGAAALNHFSGIYGFSIVLLSLITEEIVNHYNSKLNNKLIKL